MHLVEEKWDEILLTVKREHELTDISFNTWLKPLQIFAIQNERIYILVSSEQMGLTYINRKYYLPLKVAVAEVTGTEYEIEFVLPEQAKKLKTPHPRRRATTEEAERSNLNPNYTFDTFVVGNNNRFAHSAALAVAESPGEVYNPLFIYGGVGLGKTHLMQAIGNKVLENNPNAKVKFITTEDFINDFTEALRRGQKETEAFKREYRSTDLLLVDDVQFLAGKEKIQEEFFNTFNAITRENHQIVLTSDKLPKEIPGLEMRLVTRFGQGYSANITKPDLPTRVAILRNKSDQENLNIPNDVIDEIAAAVDTNVRDLEGVFNQVAGKLRFASQPVTVDTARDILETMNFKRQRAITIPIIQDTVAKFFDVTVQDLNGKKRNKEIVVPRQIAMYLARELTQDSLPQIGRAFGGKDHTTVMHSTEKIDNAIENDALLADQVQKIREELSN